MTAVLTVRALTPDERRILPRLLTRDWGAPQIVSRGVVHDASRAGARGAFEGDELVGLATYDIASGECQLLTLNAFVPGRGVGRRLLEAAIETARAEGCCRFWLVTTNDNRTAIRFYERRGLRLAGVHRGAMDEARRLKPTIPEFAADGTRISDELEFELELR